MSVECMLVDNKVLIETDTKDVDTICEAYSQFRKDEELNREWVPNRPIRHISVEEAGEGFLIVADKRCTATDLRHILPQIRREVVIPPMPPEK